ncbi:hypothetical protein [Streptomyces sp. TP-A0874]|uniref:hypothetical protein n=1 Tax=Streptomyces sp. TP-A0874 TaxID=549819 RepID=UPI00085378A0|nr:hypothetical protein [Streptomyces sp. TP-A0874]
MARHEQTADVPSGQHTPSMSDLLAAGAAANAVSTPPEAPEGRGQQRPQTQEPETGRRTAA